MPDEFAGRAIDVATFQYVELFAREIEDVGAQHDRDMDALAIENVAGHDRAPIETPKASLRLLGGNSQINHAICASPSAGRREPRETLQAP